MSSDDIAIRVTNLSKRYEMYNTPRDRLKQFVVPKLSQVIRPVRALFAGPHAALPTYTYSKEFWALKDVSFEIKRGETVGIIGRNGSGKSTLLQMICGTLNPTAGTIQTKGRIAALLELGSGFNPEFSGRDNVFLNGQILGLSQLEIESRYEAIVEFADIGDFIEQPVKTYSSGMVVRLAFSVAVNVDPEVLVVDEALAVGDTPFQVKCFSRLRRFRESGGTILFVSHSMSTVRSFCDRAIYLDRGVVVLAGAANDICRKYEQDCMSERFLPARFQDTVAHEPPPLSEIGLDVVSEETLNALRLHSPALLEKQHEGSQAVTIRSFILIDDEGCVIQSVEATKEVTAYLLIQLNQDLRRDFHASIQIYDRQGMPLMVVRDSAFSGSAEGTSGQLLVASMRFLLAL
ncbi:MAG: ATP-binding cassette domain-containing protein [Burkholderiaceae bacterium]|nr:ATP-binding cassette domain-containing protein [Burkholderiaceae bacterium]